MGDFTGLSMLSKMKNRNAALKNERSSWFAHWQEIGAYLHPRRGRFLSTERNKGSKKFSKILDATGTIALRTLQSGMLAGITSPARPWFRLTTPDPKLREFGPVRRWLEQVELGMREVFSKSNVYQALPTIYGDQGGFGGAAAVLLEDEKKVVRLHVFPCGEYALANNAKFEVDTLYREHSQTVRFLVDQFGLENVSQRVADMYQRGILDEWVEVVHVIQPREQRDPFSLKAGDKPVASVWFEKATADDQLLRESGFEESPLLSPRWDTIGTDVYGRGPGMDALADVKMLQKMQLRKGQGIDKQVSPPLVGPANLLVDATPGGYTREDILAGRQGLRSLYDVRMHLGDLTADIRETQQRIRTVFFADLFQMLTLSDRREITAREVEERHEEKLLMLGPVLERQDTELLDPMIDRTFNIMWRRGMIPEPPQELEEGEPLKVEYISILHQAQRAVSVSGVERLAGFAANLAASDPESPDNPMDKFNRDQAVDRYAEMLGTPVDIVRTDDEVAGIREQRQQQIAAAQQAQQAASMAETAKTMSETETSAGNALERVAGL